MSDRALPVLAVDRHHDPHAGAGWPYADFDVTALRAAGRRPAPLRDFVLKVHQRCNLACDYCYVYTMADQSWRDRPAAMTPRIWQAAARRIADHATRHQLPGVRVILHGGEPLLLGGRRLAELAGDIRAALPDGCAADICMQTNGVLLDEATLAVLHEQRISVGVSIDGTERVHDSRRVRANGTGSYRAVRTALELLNDPRYRTAYAGLLCTIDPFTDPLACYAALLEFEPPAVDLLLPHANWADPPRRPDQTGTADAYGRWLATIFDVWYAAPVRQTRIRLFEEIIHLLLGGRSRSDQVGLSPTGVAVIESDGDIEQVDVLKSAYEGACTTGLNVLRDPLDAVLDHPGVVARQIGTAALADTCLACPIHQVCGGGHYPHRYSPATGFHNPSVYCADLRTLITHIRSRLATDLTPARKGH